MKGSILRAARRAVFIISMLSGGACSSTLSGPGVGPTTAAPAPAVPASAPQPLGEPGYLPVAPGEVIVSLATLSPSKPDDPAPAWKEVSHEEVNLADGPVTLVSLELPGSGAGLVILAPEGGGYRVLNTYGVRHDGLGVEMSLLARWITPDRRAVVLLVEALRESRGYNAVPGDESTAVEPTATPSWAAIGATPARAWLAAPELTRYTAARFDPEGGSLRLIACLHSERQVDIFELSSATLTFGLPRAEPGPCPDAGKRHP